MPSPSRLRQSVFVLVALLLILLVPVAGLVRKETLDRQARRATLAATETYLAATDVSGFVAYLDTSLQAQQNESTWRSYRKLLQRLGALELLESIVGATNVPLLSFGQTGFTGAYEIAARFTNAPALIRVELIHTEAGWRVTDFRVSSSLTNQ